MTDDAAGVLQPTATEEPEPPVVEVDLSAEATQQEEGDDLDALGPGRRPSNEGGGTSRRQSALAAVATAPKKGLRKLSAYIGDGLHHLMEEAEELMNVEPLEGGSTARNSGSGTDRRKSKDKSPTSSTKMGRPKSPSVRV